MDVGRDGVATGQPEPVIVGYHEDFQPVWSPDGRWIAYHSHRTATPVVNYFGDNPDDIWLRRPDAPARDRDEIRLTDFGDEANSPDWSPDGTRLVFTSYDKNGTPGVSYPYIVTIGPGLRPRAPARAPGPATRDREYRVGRLVRRFETRSPSRVTSARAVMRSRVVPVGRGAARKVVEFPLASFGGVSWTPDGATLVYTSLTASRMQLFEVPAVGGTPRQLTDDSANVFTPRVSPDGGMIAATRIKHRKEIWRTRLGQ